MKPHPAAEIFPMLDGAGLAELAADIRRNGLQHKIVRTAGMILDGRNRYQACLLAEIEPEFCEWDGRGTPLEYVWSVNGPRRHLQPDQRAWIALESLPLLEAEAAVRRNTKLKRGAKLASEPQREADGVPPAEDKRAPFGASPRGKAAQLAAEAAGVSRATIERAKRIRDAAHPKLLEAVKHGEIAIGDAAAVVGEPLEVQKAALDAVLRAVRSPKSAAGEPRTLGAFVRGLKAPVPESTPAALAAPHVDLPALADTPAGRNALAAVQALGERPEVTALVTGEGFVVVTVSRAATMQQAPVGADAEVRDAS